jgi:hypothetical protein
VAIALADLLAPPDGTGEVEVAFFQEVESAAATLDRLGDYITIANAKAGVDGTGDPGALAWANYRTFNAAYLLKCNQPAAENQSDLALGSQTFTDKQILAFKAKADAYLLAYETILEALVIVPEVWRPAPVSQSVLATFSF